MTCPICQRDLKLTFHHLIPRSCHKNKKFQRLYSREEMNTGVMLCRLCHSAIHKFYSEKQLGLDYNTLDKLLACEDVQKHAKWAAKQRETARFS